MKCNLGNNDRHLKFYKLTSDNMLLWGKNEKDILKEAKDNYSKIFCILI